MRLLFWLALVVLVIFAIRKKGQSLQKPDMPFSAQLPEQSGASETMVCCDRCQVYIPSSEAIMREKKVYCCAAHADQA